MIGFNLKKTPVYSSLKWESFFPFRFAKIFKRIFLLIFLALFLAFAYGFIPGRFSRELSRLLLGLSLISFELLLCFWTMECFAASKLKKSEPKDSIKQALLNPRQYNLAQFLDFEAAKAVSSCLKYSRPLFKKNIQINSNHLLYCVLAGGRQANFIFNRALLDKNALRERLKEEMKKMEVSGQTDFSDDFEEAIIDSLKTAAEKNRKTIQIGDIIYSLANLNVPFQKFLIENNIKPEDIGNLAVWIQDLEEKIERRKKFWAYENLAKKGTLAKEWAAGYTIHLDRCSRDITESVKGDQPEFVSHKEQVGAVERILARREKNNVLIVGESGSARRSIIKGLAQRCLLGKSLAEINYKRVVSLDVAALLAQIDNQEELETILDAIFKETLLAGNIILVVDDFHSYIGQRLKPGITDIAGILAPYLRLPQFRFIGICDYEGLHKNIEQNSAIMNLFEKVEVKPVSAQESLLVLESLVPVLEQKYKIFISFPALRDIVALTDKYMPAFSFPEKAIKTLDELAVYVASSKGEKIVLAKDVAVIITEKTEIPVGGTDAKEKEVLLNLENLIHQRIVNQDEAVSDVATALRRARSGITIRKGPMGVFLFMGPTGVGKTETSKALAEFYFGSESRMIRLDMSEFQETADVSRLIGSASEPGFLTTQVRETPFSLVLLDEFEKANRNVLNLFLQVFDEGFLTDGLGRRVDFKNTIIIATSNAGYKVILEALKEKSEWASVKQKLLDYLFKEGMLRPELINRFDSVVVFKPLSKENLLAIAELMLKSLKKNLLDKGVELVITDALKQKIVELGYSPVFGAREMRRVVQDKVENVLASALLSQKIKRGNRVAVDPKDFKVMSR